MKKKYQLLKIKYAKQLIGNFLSLNLRQVTIDKEHFGCHGVFLHLFIWFIINFCTKSTFLVFIFIQQGHKESEYN